MKTIVEIYLLYDKGARSVKKFSAYTSNEKIDLLRKYLNVNFVLDNVGYSQSFTSYDVFQSPCSYGEFYEKYSIFVELCPYAKEI